MKVSEKQSLKMQRNKNSRTRKVSQDDEEITDDQERMSALDGGRAEVPETAYRTKGGMKKLPHEKGLHEQSNKIRAQSHKTGIVPLTEHDDTFCSDQNSVTRGMQKRKSAKTVPPRKNSGKELTHKSGSKKENLDKTTRLERLLQDQPDVYKKCVLSVNERSLVYAKVLDAGSTELKKIGIFSLRNRGHGFPDDEVVVEVLKKQSQESEDELAMTGDTCETMPPGKVVGVLKSANDLDNWVIECIVDESNADILRPIDRSLPSLTNLQRQKKPGHVAVFKFRDQRDIVFKQHIPVISNAPMPDIFLVRYLSWKGETPAGVVIGVFPAKESLQHSMRILRIESRNQVGFSDSAQLEIENNFPECFSLSEVELSERLDCTSMMTFTIDPPESRDIDDALSVTEMENGHHVIGVHIADVSYFVPIETELDRASRKRGTSVYEIGGKDPIAMLPKRLSSELCSLQEGQRRLTLSVFITTDENDEIINVELKKTVICSRFCLNYFQVEAALRGTQVAGAELPTELSRVLFLLNRISKRWRKNRIGHAEFSRQTNNLDFANTPMAHQIIEEMMVTANHCVAKHLLERFPTYTPLVVQQVPDEPEIQDWRRRFPSEATIIEMVQPFHINGHSLSAARDDAVGLKKKFVLHKAVWEEMTKCLEKGELEKLQSFILSPEYHPCLIVAWFNLPSFTKKALHGCSGDRKPDRHRHFSLNLSQYTQFTSPIRRYLDLVVHRLVHLSVDDQVGLSRYSQSKMSVLCEENQAIKTRVQNYESSVKNTHFADFLRQKPLVIQTLVERAIATGFKLNCLRLSAYLKLWPIDVAVLGARKVKAVQQHRRGKVILSYSLRIYDLESTAVASSVSSQDQRSPVKLSGRRHVVYTTVAAWKELVTSAMDGNLDRMSSCMEAVGASIVDPGKTISSGFQRDVTCEGSILQSVIDFSLAVAAGDVIQIQVAGEVSRGRLVPFVQLLSLSPTVDVCLEHRSNAGKCFAQLTGIKNASQGEHEDIESYCKAWTSLIIAESAENSVARNDSFLLQNVNITWLCKEEAFFEVPVEFCRERCISVFHEILTEADEEDVGCGCVGFMCLRYPGIRKKTPDTELPIGNVMDLSDPFTWVGHCVVTGIRKIADVYKIHFRLNQSSTEVPEQLLNERDSSKATVEWISNTQAERDTIRALCQMRRTDSFATAVVTEPSILPLPGKSYLALAGKHMSKIKGLFNAEQLYQIGEALCQPFSMINGYASSGKTVMAAQLAYRFSLMNRKLASTEQQQMQVLCCGPTEGSLQSLANCLCDESLGINVVLICSQEVERHQFPFPGYSKNLNCQTKRCDDQIMKLKTFYLHHRVHGSSTSNGDFIRLVDNKIALNEDVVTEDLSRYLAAIEEEKSEVLRNADVLLCSCATSIQKRIRCNTKIKQVIIDDSQACTEPETLLPLLHRSVRQVVLFGDVKQLKPCVISSIARKYGLTRSLFERYLDKEEMAVLTKQYTMHESLQHFLITCFYDNAKPNVRKVRADSTSSSRCGFWPEGSSNIPLLFLNVVGNESQSRGGSTGCVSDISNPEEARVVVEVCKWLAEKCTSEMNIAALSPYEAQCSEIGRQLTDFPKVAISSVNSAQGKHWSYVVLSTVRSRPISEKPDKKRLHYTLGVLCAKNTCNTLLSRANNGLIVIGQKSLLECDDSWKKLICYFEKYGCVMESGEFLSSVVK